MRQGSVDALLEQRPLHSEMVRKRVTMAVAELAAELEAGKSESLLRYLEFLSRFHAYSFGNCVLISVQRPNAQFVAGFRRWQQMGRVVKSGERGIAILAPMTRKVIAANKDDQAESEQRRLSGFRVAFVFDVSQTEGQPLPEFSKATGDAAALVPRLERLVAASGLVLTYDRLPFGANGCTDGNTITIRPGMASAETFRCLAHELAHCRLGHTTRHQDTSRVVRETEAEAVAFVVCRAFGIDALNRACDYIQIWTGDRDTLVHSLGVVQQTASGIIRELDGVSRAKGELVTAA